MNTRIVLPMCCAIAALLPLTMTAPAVGQPSPPVAGPKGAGDLLAYLQATRVDARFRGMEFDELIQELREQYEMNIHVTWPTIEASGVRRDQRLDIELRQVSLATLLDTILGDMQSKHGSLAYRIAGEVVVISTEDALSRITELRVYDLTDLVESGYGIRRFASTPVLSMHVTGREFTGGEKRSGGGGYGGGGGRGGGGSMFGDPGDERATEMERLEWYVDFIMSQVRPDSWRNVGGDVGGAQTKDAMLFVRHTIDAHREIEALLEMVRATRPRPVNGDVMVLSLHGDEVAAWREAIGPSFPRLPRAAVDALFESPPADDVLFRATSSGYNGARLWWSALTQRDLVTDLTPIATENVSAFSPVSGFSTEGLELVVLPAIAPDGETLALDVQMAWIPSVVTRERTMTLGASDETMSIDQVTRTMRTVSTTTELRLGDGLALSIPAQIDDAGRAVGAEEWLIVRIRAARGVGGVGGMGGPSRGAEGRAGGSHHLSRPRERELDPDAPRLSSAEVIPRRSR